MAVVFVAAPVILPTPVAIVAVRLLIRLAAITGVTKIVVIAGNSSAKSSCGPAHPDYPTISLLNEQVYSASLCKTTVVCSYRRFQATQGTNWPQGCISGMALGT